MSHFDDDSESSSESWIGRSFRASFEFGWKSALPSERDPHSLDKLVASPEPMTELKLPESDDSYSEMSELSLTTKEPMVEVPESVKERSEPSSNRDCTVTGATAIADRATRRGVA